jgi:hypothetical protein|tara:strand:- start:75 stop:698 length:624 start_codon:yes stop_codon:yes gene_type:complete
MATVNFKLIKNFFSKDELKLLKKYCYLRLDYDKGYTTDEQTDSPSYYYDPLMVSLLDLKLPFVEQQSNLKLFPTYSYWRYYVYGAKLEKHTDRPSCEVSVTACIKKYDNWPMVVEGQRFELEEGDGLLYAGCVQDHWRENKYKGEGMAQVFLHYVDQDGPFTHHAYDKYLKENPTKKTREKTDYPDILIGDSELIDKEKKNWKKQST